QVTCSVSLRVQYICHSPSNRAWNRALSSICIRFFPTYYHNRWKIPRQAVPGRSPVFFCTQRAGRPSGGPLFCPVSALLLPPCPAAALALQPRPEVVDVHDVLQGIHILLRLVNHKGVGIDGNVQLVHPAYAPDIENVQGGNEL